MVLDVRENYTWTPTAKPSTDPLRSPPDSYPVSSDYNSRSALRRSWPTTPIVPREHSLPGWQHRCDDGGCGS